MGAPASTVRRRPDRHLAARRRPPSVTTGGARRSQLRRGSRRAGRGHRARHRRDPHRQHVLPAEPRRGAVAQRFDRAGAPGPAAGHVDLRRRSACRGARARPPDRGPRRRAGVGPVSSPFQDRRRPAAPRDRQRDQGPRGDGGGRCARCHPGGSRVVRLPWTAVETADTAEGLASAIESLLDDPSARSGLVARSFELVRSYGPEAQRERLEAILASVVGASRRV